MNKLMKLFIITTCLFFPFKEVMASDPSVASVSVRTVYTDTPVSPSDNVVLFSSVRYPVSSVSVFDSSGVTMEIKVISGTRLTTLVVPPGGGGFPLKISGGDTVSLTAVSGTASSGENILTLFY